MWRDGRKTFVLFKTMGYPGIAVAVCFATASGAFIVALQHTTVANILLIQASTPLVAALIGRLVFKERAAPATWVAIGAVILVDQYLIRPNAQIEADWRPEAFMAWAIGSVCAFIVEEWMPYLSTAISAALVASVVYYAIARLRIARVAVAKPL